MTQKKTLKKLIQKEKFYLRQLLLQKAQLEVSKNQKIQLITKKKDELKKEMEIKYLEQIALDHTSYISFVLAKIKNLEDELVKVELDIENLRKILVIAKQEKEIKVKSLEKITQKEKKLEDIEEQKELDSFPLKKYFKN